MEQLFDLVLTSLWAPATYAKFAFLAVTAPFWWPLAKVMYREILPALNASPDASLVRRPAGARIRSHHPLASHRMRRSAQSGAGFAGRGRAR